MIGTTLLHVLATAVHFTYMQDGWQVETRQRLGGKHAGGLYRCFKSPDGAVFWSLRKAELAGFKGTDTGEVFDGRRKEFKAAVAKGAAPKPGSKARQSSQGQCQGRQEESQPWQAVGSSPIKSERLHIGFIWTTAVARSTLRSLIH